jgi:hypothetical protein
MGWVSNTLPSTKYEVNMELKNKNFLDDLLEKNIDIANDIVNGKHKAINKLVPAILKNNINANIEQSKTYIFDKLSVIPDKKEEKNIKNDTYIIKFELISRIYKVNSKLHMENIYVLDGDTKEYTYNDLERSDKNEHIKLLKIINSQFILRS